MIRKPVTIDTSPRDLRYEPAKASATRLEGIATGAEGIAFSAMGIALRAAALALAVALTLGADVIA